ncbi:MAG: alkaline phosphatase family protein [Alphaproteobacteria bacterium]
MSGSVSRSSRPGSKAGRPPVIAIGLDSGDIDLCTRWMADGRMPNLARLRDRGRTLLLQNAPTNMAETSWTNFAAGAPPEDTGYWSQLRLQAGSYRMAEVGSYPFEEYPPFYALGPDFRVATIDIPQTRLRGDINGVQLLAYGAHSAYAKPSSVPSELLAQVTERYGPHPTFDRDKARMWRKGSMAKLAEGLKQGSARRAAICADMLREQPWDLFLVVFSETHSGGHYLMHLGSPEHPLHATFGSLFGGADPLAEVATAVDDGIGRIVAAAPDDATFVVFSPEGMVPNNTDVGSMLFLPELLYRWNFPGKMAIRGAPHGDNRPPEPPITHPYSFGWARKVWTLKHDPNPLRRTLRRLLPVEFGRIMERVLGTPEGVGFINDYDPWFQPGMWYSDHWPKMKAFALPSYSDGYVRINLKGREPNGIVEPRDYDRVCDELAGEIMALRDSRTGEAVVLDVVRTGADSRAPKASDADLVVKWTPKPADCVTTGSFGRIGPVPLSRSGGHNSIGFAIAAGPAIDARGIADHGRLIDLAPTMLDLLGAPIPARLPGRSLVGTPQSLQAAE